MGATGGKCGATRTGVHTLTEASGAHILIRGVHPLVLRTVDDCPCTQGYQASAAAPGASSLQEPHAPVTAVEGRTAAVASAPSAGQPARLPPGREAPDHAREGMWKHGAGEHPDHATAPLETFDDTAARQHGCKAAWPRRPDASLAQAQGKRDGGRGVTSQEKSHSRWRKRRKADEGILRYFLPSEPPRP